MLKYVFPIQLPVIAYFWLTLQLTIIKNLKCYGSASILNTRFGHPLHLSSPCSQTCRRAVRHAAICSLQTASCQTARLPTGLAVCQLTARLPTGLAVCQLTARLPSSVAAWGALMQRLTKPSAENRCRATKLKILHNGLMYSESHHATEVKSEKRVSCVLA